MNAAQSYPLTLCSTGVVPTREMTPHVPLSPEALASDVEECLALGISSVHLHARDEKGQNSSRAAVYAGYIEAVRELDRDLLICASCSGRIDPSIEARAEVLALEGDLRPDMGSLTLGSMNFARSASVNEPATIMQLAEIMGARGIKPELEVFDLGMVNCAHYLISRGLIEPPYFFNIILGNPFTAQADALHLSSIVRELPDEAIWSVGGIGRHQTRSLAMGLSAGGGARVGLEDNIWFDDARSDLATNARLVDRCVKLGTMLERQPMTPRELRTKLSL